MAPVEKFAAPFTVESPGSDPFVFRGTASIFDHPVDTLPMPTLIRPGSFKRTLQDQGERVLVLWQHDQADPIGRPVAMRETSRGLEVEFRLDPEAPNGARAAAQLRSGTLKDLSIGFDPIRAEVIPLDKLDRMGLPTSTLAAIVATGADGARVLREVRLWEFSVVSHGAQRGASVEGLRFATPAAIQRDLLAAKCWHVADTAKAERERRVAEVHAAPVALALAEMDAAARRLR